VTRAAAGWLAFTAVLLWVASGPAVSGQEFRSQTDAVVVDVLATDRGRPVVGLTPRDFELRDNGVVQRVEAFAYQDLPITIILALDVSESVTGAKLEHLRAAAASVKSATRPGDRVALLTFSHQLQVRLAPTEEAFQLDHLLDDVPAEGATSLYDAAFAALTVAGRAPGRTLLVVFSDGQDTTSWTDPRRVLRAFEGSDVVVYGVVLRESLGVTTSADVMRQARERRWFQDAPYAFGQYFLPLLTDATGGATVVAERSDQLRDRFDAVIGEFRSRYVLTYSPSGVAPDGWHQIEVKLKQKRGATLARRGYLRGSTSGLP
jgi:VWFA-related protein